jgi:hypothetical protein
MWKMAREIIRQGDVVLERRAKLPRTARHVAEHLRIASESGNPHELTGKVYGTRNGMQYVVLEQESQLTHPQHDPKVVAAGVYEVRSVRDFRPQRPRFAD